MNGDVARVGAKEVKSRINEALGRLVQTVYHKLPYIEAAMSEMDIRKLFRNGDIDFTVNGASVSPLNRSQDEKCGKTEEEI